MQLFPIENYDQTLTHFINPSDADYNQTLLSPEVAQVRFQDFFCRYFDSSTTGLSPWSKTHVTTILNATAQDNIFNIEASLLKHFNNANKKPEEIGYGINFRPYTATWIKALADNIEISQFKTPIPFNPKYCGITVDNLDARALPTLDPHFYNPQIAGQGYPFDNLQLSSVWAGTPVYIIGTTINGEWHLVLTPNVLAWVKSTGIAYTDSQFITTWQKQAKQKLAAIIQTKTPIIDSRGIFRFNAYIGSVFPIQQEHTQHYTLMIPSVDEHQNAVINTAQVTKDQLAFMPLSFTPRHFATVISSLIGRPYGWGGMYFYNDCSQELKSIYTPFGIWLPQHSSEQANAGMIFDLNKLPMSKRIDTLRQRGRKFTTIVYTGGHIFIYLGKDQTYQNVWGLSPADNSRRTIIGGAVFLPLLSEYPEDLHLVSWANKKYFQISYLDQIPPSLTTPLINIKALMIPDNITI